MSLNNRDIDLLIHHHIFQSIGERLEFTPRYTSFWEETKKVLDKLRSLGFSYSVTLTEKQTICSFSFSPRYDEGEDYKYASIKGKELCQTVCLTALKVIGVEIDE